MKVQRALGGRWAKQDDDGGSVGQGGAQGGGGREAGHARCEGGDWEGERALGNESVSGC